MRIGKLWFTLSELICEIELLRPLIVIEVLKYWLTRLFLIIVALFACLAEKLYINLSQVILIGVLNSYNEPLALCRWLNFFIAICTGLLYVFFSDKHK